MANYGNNDPEIINNPIVEVALQAKENDNFYFKNNSEEQYIGLYHKHEDGTLMIGRGVLGVNHELISDEIIFQKFGYQDLQQTRERVSDIFYKIWFQSNTLSDNELFSLQTTIRDGKKQTGREEDEPLVFYKKDRNTLENRKDLQGDIFEDMCQYIFDNDIVELDDLFSIEVSQGPVFDGEDVFIYTMNFDTDRFKIVIAQKIGTTFTDILNLSQLTKPKFGNKIDPNKASEILDTNIFELLPNQTTRQDRINDFFREFDTLIGPTPSFQDVDDDGIGEQATNYETDEQSRISYENQINAYITRLISQSESNTNNQGKTLEDMRNRLNTYLLDADNIVEEVRDDRPEYENKSTGFLKIRKPNQSIIIRSPGDDDLEFQKINSDTGKPSYLEDGFTITMWVRFVNKTSEGTLFNFGNPNEIDGNGFRLETNITQDSNGKYRRTVRLVVKDDFIRDNHYGFTLSNGNVGLNRITGRDLVTRPNSNYNPTRRFPTRAHKIYPEIPTDDLNEWYFICATFNPQVDEDRDIEESLSSNKQYWLNHILPTEDGDTVVANSGLGAKCKVEIISRSNLLRARGFKIGDLTTLPIDDETMDSDNIVIGDLPIVNFSFRILEYEQPIDTDTETVSGV